MTVNINKTDFFSATRITTLVQTLANELENSQPLTFLNRTAVVPVLDDIEILGSYSGPIFAADLITDDAEAVVVEGGRFETTASITSIPKIKLGQRVSESMIRRLSQLKQGITLQGDAGLVTGWEFDFTKKLVIGVRHRQNALCAAMALDVHTYDRFGVKISGSFGAPADLKVVLIGGDLWTAPTTATPLADIEALRLTATTNYGKAYNRITMSTAAFLKLTKTDEFSERLRLFLRLEPSMFSLGLYSTASLENIFTQMTGLQLELEDSQMRVREANGNNTQNRYLPAHQVILSNTGDDNNSSAYDFANGIVTESVVAPLIAGAPQFGGEQVGPVAYYDGNISLNPPDLVAWAVMRGFPRKHDKQATAVLTVGTDEASILA
jgi:hypothetical protein